MSAAVVHAQARGSHTASTSRFPAGPGGRARPVDARGDILSRCATGLGAIGLAGAFQFAASFGSQMLLARLLAPAVFGQFAFLALILGLVGTFRNFNGGEYLVAVEERDLAAAYSTTFTLDLLLGSLCTVLAATFSRPLMRVCGRPELAGDLALLVPSCMVVSLSIPGAMLRRRLDFARLQVPAMVGQVVGPVTKILLALWGLGLRSLILGELARQIVEVALLWRIARERPGLRLDRMHVRGALRFGLPVTLSGLIAYYYWQVDTYIVGRTLTMEALGLYAVAFRIPSLLFELKQRTGGLVYAALCQLAADGALAQGYSAITRYSAAIALFPAIVGVLYARPLLELTLGKPWGAAASALGILSVATALRIAIGYLADVAKVLQRTRVLLAFTAQNAIVLTTAAMVLTGRWGIAGTAAAVLLTIAASLPPTALLAYRWLGVNLPALLWRPFLAAAAAVALGHLLPPAEGLAASASVRALALNIPIVLAAYLALLVTLDPALALDLAAAVRRLGWKIERPESRASNQSPIGSVEPARVGSI